MDNQVPRIEQFRALCLFGCKDGWSTEHGTAWIDKRNQVALHLQDLPVLDREFRNRRRTPIPGQANAWTEDPIPGLRLANACEAASNALYSLAEVAARFAASASRRAARKLPGNFNQIVKRRVESSDPDEVLREALGDVSWYKRVRELRTEWTHHSSVFLGTGEGNVPIVVVRALRDLSDRAVLGERAICTVEELCTWLREAVLTTDRFAGYLLDQFLIPRLRSMKNETFMELDYSADGHPVFLPDGRPRARRSSVADLLRRVGIDPDG